MPTTVVAAGATIGEVGSGHHEIPRGRVDITLLPRSDRRGVSAKNRFPMAMRRGQARRMRLIKFSGRPFHTSVKLAADPTDSATVPP